MYTQEIEENLKKATFTKAEVTYVMAQFRLLIEDNWLQEKYKFLNLYCNWTLHTEISGSKTAYRILEALTDSMISHNTNPTGGVWINDAVIIGLSMHKVITDIINIGIEFSITATNKFNDLNKWKPFAFVLTSVLSQKPLKFPDPITPKAQSIYDSIIAKADASGNRKLNAIVGITFILQDNIVHWRVTTFASETEHKFVDIEGPFAFITEGMVDTLLNP